MISMLQVAESLVSPAIVFPGLGLPELLIILFIVLLLLGPKKLPEMGRAIGQSIKELRKSNESGNEDQEKEVTAKQ